MKWQNRRRSSNVEDRRGSRRVSKGGMGLGVIALGLLAMYFGVDPQLVMNVGNQLSGGGTPIEQGEYRPTAEEQQLAAMVETILADTEDAWNAVFTESGARYPEPKLVMFTGMVQSGCGTAQAAMGPFYCPADQKVYIDLAFYREMKQKFRAPGDFAQAYVVAHEVGHHVQHVLGIDKQVGRDRKGAESAAVRLELQADCFAGVWAHRTQKAKQFLEEGDIEEAMNAASAIGDDAMQRRSTGMVRPDSFTHGSSEQRVRWFKRGLVGGKVSHCDTFAAASL
ncbi:MAG: neutral zinc metallopeptidase [Pseudomonadota bacterium]